MANSGCILVVDDDRSLREMLAEYLGSHGFNVALAADGESMRVELERACPDLVLLDLRLPRLDGFSVLREIKNAPALRHIPVVVLTSSSSDRDVEQAYAEHANSYLVKPHDYERLVTLLGRTRDYWLVRNRGPRR